MTDINPMSSSIYSGNTLDYWNNPANWAKPISATAQNSNSGGNSSPVSGFGGAINSEQTNNNTPAGAFGTSGAALPSTPAAQAAANTATAPQSGVGNTTQQNTGTTNGLISSNNALLSPQGGGEQAQGQQQGQQSGLSGFSNAVSSLGSNVATSIFGSGGLTGAINSFGTNLGFGQGASFIGPPTAEAGSLTGTSLSGVLGGAGIGAGIGSLISSFSGGNSTNSAIGGGIGGALGAASGVTSGLLAGAELGSVIPGLGTIIGGVGGALLGGLFGPGTPTNADSYNENINPNGSLNASTSSGGSKNPAGYAGFGQSGVNALSMLAQGASSALGIQFNSSIQLGNEISTKHPGPNGNPAYVAAYDTSKNATISGANWYTPTDSTSVSTAYYNTLLSMAQDSGYTNTQALHDWFYNSGNANSSSSDAFNPVTIAPRHS